MIFFILLIIIGFVGYKLISFYKLVRHYEQVVIPSAIVKYLSNDIIDPIPLNEVKGNISSKVDVRAIDICLRFLKSQQSYREINPFQHQAIFVFMLRKVLVTLSIIPHFYLNDENGENKVICLSATFLEDEHLDSRLAEIKKYISECRWKFRSNLEKKLCPFYPPDGIHEILIYEYLTNKEFAQFYDLNTPIYADKDDLPIIYQKFTTIGDTDEYALIIESDYAGYVSYFLECRSTRVSIFKINESTLNKYPFLKNTPLHALYAN